MLKPILCVGSTESEGGDRSCTAKQARDDMGKAQGGLND